MAIIVSQNVFADTEIMTTVNGQPVRKDLIKLTFESNLVTLTFSDTTSQTAEMDAVIITLDHEVSSALEMITADPEKVNGVYDIMGRYLGETPKGLKQGIYIINGQKVYIK